MHQFFKQFWRMLGYASLFAAVLWVILICVFMAGC